jgi:flagellar hook assembly protein FlgD
MIASLACAPTDAGAEVTFSLSSRATVTCTVRNIAGRIVRTLRPAAIHAAGSNVILWDGRSDTGCSTSAGQYMGEMAASAPDGQTARRLTVLTLRR